MSALRGAHVVRVDQGPEGPLVKIVCDICWPMAETYVRQGEESAAIERHNARPDHPGASQ